MNLDGCAVLDSAFFLKASAKVLLFFYLAKFLTFFFGKDDFFGVSFDFYQGERGGGEDLRGKERKGENERGEEKRKRGKERIRGEDKRRD